MWIIIIIIIGPMFGLFAFSQIIYPLFVAWLRASQLGREGKLKKPIPVSTFIAAPIAWSALLCVSIWAVNRYFGEYVMLYYGTLGVTFVIVVAQIPKKNRDLEVDFKDTWKDYLKEESENVFNGYPQSVRLQSGEELKVRDRLFCIVCGKQHGFRWSPGSGVGKDISMGYCTECHQAKMEEESESVRLQLEEILGVDIKIPSTEIERRALLRWTQKLVSEKGLDWVKENPELLLNQWSNDYGPHFNRKS
jgi:hypothetical protein